MGFEGLSSIVRRIDEEKKSHKASSRFNPHL